MTNHKISLVNGNYLVQNQILYNDWFEAGKRTIAIVLSRV